MTENLMFNQQKFFEKIVERGIDEGVADREGFNSLVETMIENKMDIGELHTDNDLEAIEDEIKARWPQYEARLNDQVA